MSPTSQDTLVIVGDALLDVDWEGDVRRLCPDEPAPVVEAMVESARPGGAGLAATIAAREQPVVLVTALGEDAAGTRLRELLDGRVRIVDLGADRTVTKTRVRAGGRTLLRMDHEHSTGMGEPAVTHDLRSLFASATAVLVSDYGLGISGRPDVRDALVGLPRLVWDPHPRGATPVPGVSTATPNLAEARHFSEMVADDVVGAIRQAQRLCQRWGAHSITVTCGADGAVLVNGDGTPLVATAPAVVTGDSCGAGDAFAVAVTAGLGGGLTVAEAVSGAVEQAAAYLRAGGVAGFRDQSLEPAPDVGAGIVARTRSRGGRVVMAGGCFDLLHPGHVAYLEGARSLGDCLVVALNSDDSVRRLKGDGRPVMPEADRARVLEALSCVDAVEIFDEPTPERLLREWRPDIFAKGGDYHESSVPEAPIVHAYGGEVVVLPTLAGRSSTRLASAARAAAHHEEDSWQTRTA